MTQPTYDITVGDDFSLYDGFGIRDPEETWLPISLDGRGFVADMSDDLGYYHRYQRTSLNLTNTQQANNGGDQAQTAPEVFRRVTESWELGVGQDRYDRDNSAPLRFRDCYRVDVFNPWKVSLLPDVLPVLALGAGRVWLQVVGTHLVVVQGQTLYWYSDIGDAPTTADTTHPIVAATTDGLNLYVLDNLGHVVQWSDPLTSVPWVTLSGFDSSRALLGYVKGFLVAAAGSLLLDISSGAAVTIYQHPNADFTWRDACDGLAAAYLVGGLGQRWSILEMTLKSDATTFDPPSVAAPLPDGQVAHTIASYLGYLLVGLEDGWVFGSTDTAGKLTYGRLIRTDTPVLCFEGQDRFVWYGMNGSPALTTAGLGRADLSAFSAVLTPANAPDLSTSVTTGQVTAVVTFADKRVFAIDGSGVWGQADFLAQTGWLRQGDVSFNTSDVKQGLYADIHHEALHGTLGVDVSYDDAGFGSIGINTNGGSVTMGHLTLANPFTKVELRYDLTRSEEDVTLGPVLTRAEIRAIPVSGRATEWRLPLRLAVDVDWDNNTQSRNVDADYDLLMDLYTSKRPVRFREAQRLYTVYCSDFLFLGERHENNGRSVVGIFIVNLREVV